MTENARQFAEYLSNTIVAKLVQHPEGDAILSEGPHGIVDVQFADAIQGMESASAVAAFEYPNTLIFTVPPLPESGDYNKPDEDKLHLEAKVAIATVHELLHRQQAYKEGTQAFFEAKVQPIEMLSAQLLIEAENYARTSQIAWRIANAKEGGYKEIADYMLGCSPNNHMESSHIKYATAMKDKEITPENELLAMRAVVKDFLFDNINSQIYTASRLTQVYDYYKSGELQKMLEEKPISEVRDFMKEQPNIIGMGADKAEYKPENIIKLGDTPAGNLLEIQEGGLEHMKHPNFATIFMNDSEKRQIAELQQFSSLLTDIMQINADISKNIGNISELPTSDSQFFVNKINSRTSIPKVPYR